MTDNFAFLTENTIQYYNRAMCSSLFDWRFSSHISSRSSGPACPTVRLANLLPPSVGHCRLSRLLIPARRWQSGSKRCRCTESGQMRGACILSLEEDVECRGSVFRGETRTMIHAEIILARRPSPPTTNQVWAGGEINIWTIFTRNRVREGRY